MSNEQAWNPAASVVDEQGLLLMAACLLHVPKVHCAEEIELREGTAGEKKVTSTRDTCGPWKRLAGPQPTPPESYSCDIRRGPPLWRALMGHFSSQFISDVYNLFKPS